MGTKTVKFTHQLTQYENGAILFPPPYALGSQFSMAQPDVMVESSAALYPIGTLAWFPGMGKKFRYSLAGGALIGTRSLAINANYVPDSATYANDGGFYGHCELAGVDETHAIGATVLHLTGTQNTARDFYAGGHLIHFDAARNICYEESYVISGPAAAATTPWQSMEIVLAEPKKYAVLAADGIEIWCNPYSNLKVHTSVGSGYSTAMGVPLIPVQSGYYFWLQTAGPIFITPNGWSTLCPGYAANSRMVMTTGGNITTQAAAGAGYQPIGVLLAATEAGYADAWLNLDLDLGH